MDVKTVADAKADLEILMDRVVRDHMPVIIARDGKPAVVMMSLEDWNSEQETQHLLRSTANRSALQRSSDQLARGATVTKSIEELEELAADQKASAAE